MPGSITLPITSEKTVRVTQYKQVTPELGALAFVENDVTVHNLFNVPPAAKELLNRVDAGARVDAVIAPDSSGDKDKHPEVRSVQEAMN